MAFIIYAVSFAISLAVTVSIIAAAVYLRQIRDILSEIRTAQGYILHKLK